MPDRSWEPLTGPSYPDTLEAQTEALESDPQLNRFRASRERLSADPYRPLYHFSPPENVMNDPNGLCHWDGRYHLFYQFVPEGGSRLHWGHAVSEDLVRWQDLPVALYPDTEKDCFSGQALVEPDRVVAIYHGTESGNAIATAADPLLLNWKKHPRNPVIPIVPIDDVGSPYRVFDPCIWKEADGYYALSGTYRGTYPRTDCRAVDHVFRSPDLAAWEYLGPLVDGVVWTEPGEDGAVPNFLPIGDGKHLLLFFSHKRAGQYYIGTYDREAHRLTTERHGRMNYGPINVGSLHAPSACIDASGRLLAFFNVKEGKPSEGWNDVMTLPRVLSLDGDGGLAIRPAEELDALRFDGRSVGRTQVPADGEVVLEGIGGKAVALRAIFEPGAAREVGLYVLRSPDGAERTRVSLYRQDHRRYGTSSLQIDVSEASTRPDVYARTPEAGPLVLGDDEPLELRVYVDRSIVEVFANGRQCLTLRAYPARQDSRGVSLFARGGPAVLRSLDCWQMRSVWPELTSREGA